MRTLPILLIALCLLAACGAPQAPQPPNINLQEVELLQLGLQEQRFRLRLEVENPNSIPLPLQRLSYSLSLDGNLIGQGESGDSVRVAAGGRETLTLELAVDSIRLLGQLSEWSRSPPSGVDYLLQTEMHLGPWPRPLQISHEGRADLSVARGAFSR